MYEALWPLTKVDAHHPADRGDLLLLHRVVWCLGTIIQYHPGLNTCSGEKKIHRLSIHSQPEGLS